MRNKGTHQEYEAQLNTPVGKVKVIVEFDLQDETSFQGIAKLMGVTEELRNGRVEGDTYYFDITVNLPFGKVELAINATADEDGNITGEAIAPRRKPIKIVGKQTA